MWGPVDIGKVCVLYWKVCVLGWEGEVVGSIWGVTEKGT